MSRPPRLTAVEQHGDVACVSLTRYTLNEPDVLQMADEVVELIDGGCRKLVFRLGPGALQCLFSVFLAKLVMFQRVLRERGGAMKISDVTPEVRGVFEACRLHQHFDFADDMDGALEAFARQAGRP